MAAGFIPSHGGYKDLLSYRKAEIVYDATVCFCGRFLDKKDRTYDQMVQAGRSGKQNIVEGTMASGGSKEMELKLLLVARSSQEELLKDYHDYLRTHDMRLWAKDCKQARFVRGLCRDGNETYETYRTYVETRPAEIVANIVVCLLHQASYLLDQQIRAVEQAFVKEGGIRERMWRARAKRRAEEDEWAE